MKLFLFGFLILTIAQLCQGGIGVINYPPNTKYGDKCPISESLILSPGDTIKDPRVDCGQIWCLEGGVAEFKICAPYGPPIGFTFGDYVDLSLPFPQCCEQKLIKL